MTFVYPSLDIDRSALLLGLLGTHWSASYQDSHTIEQLLYARGRVDFQRYLNLLEAVASVCRFTVPIFHHEHWYPLILKESERNGDAAKLRYGDGAVFGYQPDGGEYKFGDSLHDGTFYFPTPADLQSVSLGFNRLTDPSRTLTHGQDFVLHADRGLIQFRTDPFADDLVPKRQLFKDGVASDREAVIWLFRGSFDWHHIYEHFGYALNLQLSTNEGYRDLVNAIWDALVEGTHVAAVRTAIGAMAGTPLVIEATETVESVFRDHRALFVSTDQHLYRYPLQAQAVVEVGDVVHAGDSLSDTITFCEFNRGEVPDGWSALALGPNMLTSGFFSGLVFSNKDVPLVVTNDGIYTKLSFELGGWPADIEKFFDDLQQRGIVAGRTLAHLLDQRTNKVGEPTAAALPATINPFKFLCENVLRTNAFGVRLEANHLGIGAAGLENLGKLRRITPPHTLLLVLLELAVDNEVVTMDGPGSATDPGYEEDPGFYSAAEPIGETLGPELISEAPTFFYTNRICL